MKTLKQFFTEEGNQQLGDCFLEYEDWVKTGVLKDGKLRSIYNKFCEENNAEYFPINSVIEPLLYEMVKRYRTMKM